MKRITLKGPSGKRFTFQCDDVIGKTIAINPVLPERFDDTPNDMRDDRARAWWGVPYVVTYRDTSPAFVRAWGGPVRYDVRCLDGGAWDRSTVLGSYGNKGIAVLHAAQVALSLQKSKQTTPPPPNEHQMDH